VTSELYDLSAAELSGAFRDRTLSPVDVTRAVLDRIETWEPSINAMYVIDADGALEQAAASEVRWGDGESLSPLDGVPITIKENIATTGVPVPLGTAATALSPATDDAPPAARVREAGCVVIGKTTMPDFGMLASGVSSFHGTTRNPWNTQRNPFGSSSGAAAGLAAGYGPLALGTDIGGSVRLPAAACGVFALKPSLGRVPIHPPYLGRVCGPMTRTVTDAALLMNVITRPDARDYMALPYDEHPWDTNVDGDVSGKRFGLVLNIGMGRDPTPDVRTAVEAAAERFASAGAIVEAVEPFLSADILTGVDRFFAARLLAEYVGPMSVGPQAAILPFITSWCRRAEDWSATDALLALGAVMEMRERAHNAVQPFDFLLSPTAPMTAYAADEATPGDDPDDAFPHIGFTSPFNFSEQPAASVYTGLDADGLPIGLQIAGHRFDDLGVLQMARAYELLRPSDVVWPEPPN
jgi:Asp-tRNA(Asn)/Glu-tRNA(Gln) amidotransferase A subunit family amidase